MAHDFLRSAWLAGIFFVTPSIAADEKSPRDLLYTDLQEMACANEYLILGDTYHPDTAIMGFVGDDATLSSMASCGIEKLFVEIMPKFQGEIDLLARGTLSRKDFVLNSELSIQADKGVFADMVITAGRAGFDVIAFDVQGEIFDERLMTSSRTNGFFSYSSIVADAGEEELASKIFMHAWLHVPIGEDELQRMRDIVGAHPDHPSFKIGADYFAEADRIQSLTVKRTDDAMLVDFLKARKDPGERIAILIGNGHPSDREVGIDVRLGPQNTAWVALQGEKAMRGDAVPDRIYDLVSHKVIIPALGL